MRIPTPKLSAITPSLLLTLVLSGLMIVSPVIYLSTAYLTFDLPKLAVLQAVVEGSFCLWLVWKIIGNNPFPLRDSPHLSNNGERGKKNSFKKIPMLYWCLLAYLVINAISTIAAFSTHQAWWGSYYRRQGFLLLLHDLALFLIVFSTARSTRLFRYLLTVVALSGIGVGTYAVLEFFGLPDFSHWKSGGEYFGRLVSTFGQPNLSAGFVGMALMATLYFVVNIKKWWRIPWIALCGLYLFTIFGSLSRGAWLSLLATCLIGGIYLVLRTKKTKTILIGLTGFVIAAALGVGIFYAVVSRTDYAWRVQEITNLRQLQQSERYLIWEKAVVVIKDNFWWGLGADNFELVFPSYLNDNDQHLQQVYVDRAHNFFLDMALNAGLWGVLSFLVFLGSVIYSLRKVNRVSTHLRTFLPRTPAFYLLLAVLFYLLQGQVNINGILLDALFWFILALLASLPYQIDNANQKNIINPKPGSRRLICRILLVVLFIGASAAAIRFNFQLIAADIAYKDALQFELVNSDKALSAYQTAIDLAPQADIYRLRFADRLIRLGYDETDPAAKKEYFSAALQTLLHGVHKRSSADLLYRLGQTYQFGQSLVSDEWQEQADKYYQAAHQAAPYKF